MWNKTQCMVWYVQCFVLAQFHIRLWFSTDLAYAEYAKRVYYIHTSNVTFC